MAIFASARLATSRKSLNFNLKPNRVKFLSDKSSSDNDGKQQKPATTPTAETSSSYSIPLGYLTNYLSSLLFTSSKTSSVTPSTSTTKPVVKRMPVISRDALRERTLGLVTKLKTANTSVSQLMRTEELCSHLLNYPQSSSIVLKESVAPLLWRWRRTTQDQALAGQISECLALLGHVAPPQGRGIRLLSIDGGGTRGLMALEILESLEQLCPEYRINQLFDYIIGVSTGALIAAMIGGLQLSVPQCKKIYREISVKLFDQNRLMGSLGLLRSHSYYDTDQWVVTLRQAMGEKTLTETARNRNCPKLGIVSCIVNQPNVLEPFIFRNYHYNPDHQSIYPGSAKYKLWQALQASAAAPGYFEECKLDFFIHQDGGVVVNNPTAIGIHECKMLWPDKPLECVVSVGTGKNINLPSEPTSQPQYSTTKDKILKIIGSATDCEKVHTILHDLLPPETYCRLNPYMTYPYGLDEINNLRLQQLTQDARIYVRKNRGKLQDVAKQLTKPKSFSQNVVDTWNQILTFYK